VAAPGLKLPHEFDAGRVIDGGGLEIGIGGVPHELGHSGIHRACGINAGAGGGDGLGVRDGVVVERGELGFDLGRDARRGGDGLGEGAGFGTSGGRDVDAAALAGLGQELLAGDILPDGFQNIADRFSEFSDHFSRPLSKTFACLIDALPEFLNGLNVNEPALPVSTHRVAHAGFEVRFGVLQIGRVDRRRGLGIW